MTKHDAHKKQVTRQFGQSAQDYAFSDVHAKGESLEQLLELVPASDDWQMIDVATGAGHTALAFAPHVQKVIATDITQEMLEQTARLAREKNVVNLQTEIADAEALPFEDDSVDFVTCRLAFHHFENPTASLSEFQRVLKPGGFLGFTDNYTVPDKESASYYNRFEKIRDPSHHWVCSLEQLQKKFEHAGFKLLEQRTLSKEFEFHEWADRQRVSDLDKAKLRELMQKIPSALVPLFQPRFTDHTFYFHLAEVVILARKKS